MQEDFQLIKKTLEGNEQAFQQLIRKYYRIIYGQVFSIAQNHSDAEELVNDVFVKAYVNLLSLRQPSEFYSWLRQIAQHHCLDWIRRNSAKNRDISLLSLEQITDKMDSSVASFVDDIIEQEKLDKVIEAINLLPEKDKALMRDYYLNEMSQRELQVRHSLSEDAVKQRLARSRQKIKESLKYLFSWFGMPRYKRRALKGDAKVMSMGAKIAIIISIAILMLGGTSFLIWNYKQSEKATYETESKGMNEKIPSSSTDKELPSQIKQTKPAQTTASTDDKKSQIITAKTSDSGKANPIIPSQNEQTTVANSKNGNDAETVSNQVSGGAVIGTVKSSIRVMDNSPNGFSSIQNPVAGAIVTVENQTLLADEGGKRSVTSDADGNYEIANLPEGSYTIISSMPGFHDWIQSVTITNRTESCLDLWMRPLSEPPITNVEYVPIK